MSIKITNLKHSYNSSRHALNGVDLLINKGEFIAIIGETGSGKSTLVQHLNALLIPNSGEVQVNNILVTSNKRKNKHITELRKQVGLVFQFPEYQLFEETVLKDVSFGLKNFGYKTSEAEAKAKEALRSVGIPESYYEKSPFELSGGERRKVAIAGIISCNPDVLVLDEPTAGLDATATREIMSLVKQMHKQGKTIILVSHDMELVTEYADRVVVLQEGLISFEGTPSELFMNLDKAVGIEIPPLFELAIKLKNRGVPLALEKIKTASDLVEQYLDWRR